MPAPETFIGCSFVYVCQKLQYLFDIYLVFVYNNSGYIWECKLKVCLPSPVFFRRASLCLEGRVWRRLLVVHRPVCQHRGLAAQHGTQWSLPSPLYIGQPAAFKDYCTLLSLSKRIMARNASSKVSIMAFNFIKNIVYLLKVSMTHSNFMSNNTLIPVADLLLALDTWWWRRFDPLGV